MQINKLDKNHKYCSQLKVNYNYEKENRPIYLIFQKGI